ncbi:cytochrome c biogenesis CcdA family protein [Methanospirillum lacunae]|uniref:Cytochrome C biogenesis protein transmembrane domain-containing protein n=1 Tax=Methanospirillum lacunae TaxID=668570 RepID=A0A2V2MYM8_9EURY|nr:hypothetical protein [Methanospirillum lacunae]PWR70516.1 hypothetical protein DK846_14065 [Methanospirillum lacunae]
MSIRQSCQHYDRVLASVLAGLLFVLILCTGPASAGVFLKNGSDVIGDHPADTILSDPNTTPGDYSATFFYNTHCGACHLAMTYLNEYSAAHPGVVITSYDLFNSSENKVLFEQYKAEYHRQYVSVPSVFIGNAGLEGESAIRENFDSLVTWYGQNKKTGLSDPNSTNVPVKKGTWNVISIPLVLIAGLVDGINPCASAVLVFLLALLMTIRQKQRLLLAGIVFTCAVYLMYFISGTGIYSLPAIAGILRGYTLIAGILAVVIGLLWIREGIISSRVAETPDQGSSGLLCEKLHTMTIPIAFGLGLLTGVLELSCTGGIYLAIQDMISFRVDIVQGLVYLFLYNLAFIVPLLLITLLFYWWIPTEETEGGCGRNPGRFTIFAGMLLLVFAFLIMSGLY